MKYSEMNAHEKEAYRYIVYAMSNIVAGYELTLNDYPEESEEYKEAKEFLESGRENLNEEIYREVMACSDRGVARHLRFAGEAFIRERIDRRLAKWGY